MSRARGSMFLAVVAGTIMKEAGLQNLDIPFGYIKSYLEQLDNGETIERSLDKIEKGTG
jgi:hypothetical protein